MQLLSLVLNFVGTVILAVSAGNFFNWVSLSLNAHEITIQTLLSKGDVLNIAGATKHMDDALKKSGKWMIFGIILVISGFAIQVYIEYKKLCP